MDGLWIAHFNAGAAHGNGIAVLRAGEILGGDFAHTWTGTYEKEGPSLYARVRVAPYSGEAETEVREHPSMITLSGMCDQKDAVLAGHPDESELAVSIEMHKAG
jgi:hypothetical protein